LAFFDAEDQGLINGWPYSVGARVMAGKLPQKPSRVIIVDMVGDTNQTLYLDYNSQRPLSESIWQTATELGYGDFFIPQPRHRIVDDHLPFAEQGIPAVDIIDFDYSHWHTTADTTDKVSPDSLERVGRTLVAWLEKPSEF
jgi:Zn-dependent M28 family amino/carboxypeptidase